MTTRRNFVGSMACGAGMMSLPLVSNAETATVSSQSRVALDFTSPKDNLYGFMKLFGDISGRRTFNYQPGRIYAYRQGELPRHLMNYAGITINEVRPDAAGEKYTIRFTGAMLMQDPITNEVIDVWENPWTGEKREVAHFSTDRAMRSYGIMGEKRPSGTDYQHNKFDSPFILPWQTIGDLAWAPHEVFWIYTDRDGNPRYECAIQTYLGKIAEIEDRSLTSAASTIASQSQSPYFVWMGGLELEGHMILTSNGRKLDSIDSYPQGLLEEFEARFPGRLDIEFPWDEEDTE